MSRTKKILLSVSGIFLIIILLFFVSRNYILQNKISSMAARFHNRTGGVLLIKHAAFSSIATVKIQGVSVISPEADTLLKLADAEISLSLKKLLRFRVFFSRLAADDIDIRIIHSDSLNNFSFLTRKSSKHLESKVREKNYARFLTSVLGNVFDITGSNIALSNIKCSVTGNSSQRILVIPKIACRNGNFEAEIKDLSKLTPGTWLIKGSAADDETAINFSLVKAPENTNRYFPFFDVREKFNAGLRSLSVSIEKINFENDVLNLTINAEADSLVFNHWRIAENPVIIGKYACIYNIVLGKNNICSDSTSWFQFNNIRFNSPFYFEKSTSKKIEFGLNFKMASQDFFNSLPTSVFPLFEGIKTKGNLNYSMQFKMDNAKYDSLVFSSALRKEKFAIIRYGREYFPRINQSFLFDAYDKSRFVKSFWVGTENPDFTPLPQISTTLQYAVLTSEDPSFFHHHGFVEEAFRESIITNLKEKRFVRGGSTISMQIVKNVFLSREKNIARKLQEILITWFMENNYLVSKERLFEIYLNVIEWGPNIYGIKEASRFYFHKNPSELTLAESIYLASIIPHPKYFKYSFDKEGKLKPFLSGYFKLITNRMISKTWITPLDTFGLKPEVILKGEALNYILPTDSIPVGDTAAVDDDILN